VLKKLGKPGFFRVWDVPTGDHKSQSVPRTSTQIMYKVGSAWVRCS
jgi:hypothetical protein